MQALFSKLGIDASLDIGSIIPKTKRSDSQHKANTFNYLRRQDFYLCDPSKKAEQRHKGENWREEGLLARDLCSCDLPVTP